MSYDPLKDPGSNPPAYLYNQQAVSDGYQHRTQQTGSVQQQHLPETNSTLDQQNENTIDRDEEPSSVSVAHLNVSYRVMQVYIAALL